MATLPQVIDQMTGAGLPALPSGHPVLDGKIHRFGPKKKAWYALREFTLRSGKSVVTGAFGIWQGSNNNAIPVSTDWEGVSAEDLAEAERKQAELAAAEEEKRLRVVELAANRARGQWGEAEPPGDGDVIAYCDRKQIPPDGVRLAADGTLLIPMRRYTREGAPIVGLQKILPDGSKRFTRGMDKVGSSFLLGAINDQVPVIGLAEGYATGQSVRVASERRLPVMVAFDAGNLLSVAKQLRADWPAAHLLFFADDDHRLLARFAKFLSQEFGVAQALAVDGNDHIAEGEGGQQVTVRATWRKDNCGTDYIEADIRSGRMMRLLKFENAGISRARAAARAVGNASVAAPVFANRGENEWSDFNDLQAEEGIEAVRSQVLAAIEKAGTSEPTGMPEPLPVPISEPQATATAPVQGKPTLEQLLAHFAIIYSTTDVWDELRKQKMKRSAFIAWAGKDLADKWSKHPDQRVVLRENLPTLINGRAAEAGSGGWRLDEMLQNLTLLRGTETVWDAIGQQVMGLGAVRADYTSELTSKWQEHPMRKTIEAKNLLFDPTQRADPANSVNIFLGWPLIPQSNEKLVEPILALLASLCSAEDQPAECVDWILRWLAYPLQHPGAKMQTAVLMFGEKQGTGKSLFFQDVVMPIYGDYGIVASQHQLDSTFTAWRSRKLFVLFEEVLSRDDKYSHNGTLKYMITGKSMSINQKNLPEREERNHMNSVFLSNEPQPIPIELEDRRFLVVEARQHQQPEFYEAVRDSIQAGGVQAFYHFLLNYPLDGFNEHTKPLMTLAKERVIEFGLNGWLSFHRAWKDGYLGGPYCSCLSEDLYILYKRWCDRSGEKPLSLTKFSGLLASREKKVKKLVAVGNKPKATRMIFEIESDEEKETIDKQIERFRKVADIRSEAVNQV